MKTNAKLINNLVNKNGNLELTFEITELQSKIALEQFKNVDYVLTVKEKKSQRSINQNNFFWKVVSLVSKEIGMDEIDLYIQLLEMTNASYLTVQIKVNEIDKFNKQFRAVKLLDYVDFEKTLAVFKVYLGSSTFNIKEMNELIDKALEYASNCDISILDERIESLL